MLPSPSTSGMNRALSSAARMLAVRISLVFWRNSASLASSRTRVLVVIAPMMSSLKAPVIWLFILRTMRWLLRMRFWKKTQSAASGGMTQSTSRPSFQFIASSTATMPSTKSPDQARSTKLQAIISERPAMSLMTRAISQPTEVVS